MRTVQHKYKQNNLISKLQKFNINIKLTNFKKSNDVKEIFKKSVQKVFHSLGISSNLYFILENRYNIKPYDYLQNIDEFIAALENVFGLGATLLKIKIMKELYDEIGNNKIIFTKSDKFPTFSEYVKILTSNIKI